MCLAVVVYEPPDVGEFRKPRARERFERGAEIGEDGLGQEEDESEDNGLEDKG